VRETSTAVVTLREDGILVVRIRQGAIQRPDDARANLAAAKEEAAGRRRPLLVDITGSPPLEAETRHLYSGHALDSGFLALALLVETSPLGRMMGNVYFRVARPGIPMHLFTAEERAIQWLQDFLS
jgi:hypothetical protein